MYELNKIYNEDCYKAIKEIPDKSVDLIIIDPPYQFCSGGKEHSPISDRKIKSNLEMCSLDTENTRKAGTGYQHGGGCFGTQKRNYHSEIQETDVTKARKKYQDYIKEHGKDEESERLRIIANKVDDTSNTRFISKGTNNSILDECCRVLKKINIYIWCNKEQLRQYIDYFSDKGCFIDLLTWHKTNPIPTCNNTYLPDTEYCVFARESGVKIYGDTTTKKKYYVSSCNVDDKADFAHPTIKPLEIIRNLVINSSKENDVVLDCFMGSGTTAVACKETNRNFIGFELNEKYCKIANDRINGITANGQTSIFTDFDNL